VRPVLSTFSLICATILAAPEFTPALRADTVTAFYQTAINASPTSVGAVDVTLTSNFATSVGYLNIGIDFNHNGNLSGTEWVIQNDVIPILPTEFGPSHPVSASVPFSTTGLSLSNTSYSIFESFTSSPLGSQSAIPLNDTQLFSTYDIDSLQTPGTGLDGSAGLSTGATDWSSVAASGDISADAVIGRVRYDIPGILQGVNECAPTAAAQSLLWLKARYGDLATLPNQAQLITDLKTGMSWTASGINPNNFVPGKNFVTTKYSLPVSTTAGGAFNGTGTFNFIKQEIEAGEDVEMRIQYPGDGGHWVTIAGWYDDGTTQKLYFKDPLTGGNTVDEYVINGTTITNYKYGNGTISFAVGESIVPEPGTFVLFGAGMTAMLWWKQRSRRRR
jgi:hypothetical protein